MSVKTKTTIVPKPFTPKKGAYVTFDTQSLEPFEEAQPLSSTTISPDKRWPATTWPCSTRFIDGPPPSDLFHAQQALALVVTDSKLYNGLLDWLAHADDLEVIIDPGSTSTANIAKTSLDVHTLNPALMPGVKVPRIASTIRERYFGSRYDSLLTKIADQQNWSEDQVKNVKTIVVGYITYLTQTQGSKQAAQCLASIRRAVFKSLLPDDGPTLADGKLTLSLKTENEELRMEICQNTDMQKFVQVWLRWWALNSTDKMAVTGDGFVVETSYIGKGSVQDVILNGTDGEGGDYTVSITGCSDFAGNPDADADESLIPQEYAVSDSDSIDEFNDLTEDTEIVLNVPKGVDAPKIDWTTETDIYPIISITGAVAQGFNMYAEKGSIPGFVPLSVEHSKDAANVNRNRRDGTQYKIKSMKEGAAAKALDAPSVEILFPEHTWENLWVKHVADLKTRLYTALTEANAYQYTVRGSNGQKTKVYALLNYVDTTGFTLPNVSDARLSPSVDAADTFTTFELPSSFALPVNQETEGALDLIKVKSSFCKLDVAGRAYKKAHDMAVAEYVRRLKDSDVPLDPNDGGFPWWILGIVGAIAVLAVVIVNVVQNKKEGTDQNDTRPSEGAANTFRS